MTENKTVDLLLSGGKIEGGSLEVVAATECKLVFSGIGPVRREFTARDLFDALISLRLVLEDGAPCTNGRTTESVTFVHRPGGASFQSPQAT